MFGTRWTGPRRRVTRLEQNREGINDGRGGENNGERILHVLPTGGKTAFPSSLPGRAGKRHKIDSFFLLKLCLKSHLKNNPSGQSPKISRRRAKIQIFKRILIAIFFYHYHWFNVGRKYYVTFFSNFVRMNRFWSIFTDFPDFLRISRYSSKKSISSELLILLISSIPVDIRQYQSIVILVYFFDYRWFRRFLSIFSQFSPILQSWSILNISSIFVTLRPYSSISFTAYLDIFFGPLLLIL